jgi:hypothetical protein
MENSSTFYGHEIYEEYDSSMRIATGDLFSPVEEFGRSDFAGVVLTPMCDLAQGKTEWVKLALAMPLKIYLAEQFIPKEMTGKKYFQEMLEQDPKSFGYSFMNNDLNGIGRDNNKTSGLVNNLAKILKNTSPIKLSHYYLPGKEKLTEGFLVDFSHVMSVSYDELCERSLLLRVTSPWREQLLNRYIGYSLRVGTKDYTDDGICKTIKAFFNELDEDTILKKMKQ